jgi:hypothetical protein
LKGSRDGLRVKNLENHRTMVGDEDEDEDEEEAEDKEEEGPGERGEEGEGERGEPSSAIGFVFRT